MKKLLLTILFSLVLSGVASAEEKVLLACQIKDKSEGPFYVTIDLKNKVLDRAGNLYKITNITDDGISSKREININDISYFAEIAIDRQRGNMIFQNSKKLLKDSQWEVFEKINYSCNKSPLF